MTKSELRKLYLEKRLSLSEAEYLQFNRQLCDIFFSSIDLSFIKVIHFFLPITEKREPDAWLILDRIKREFPHVRIAVPRANNKSGELENFYFEGLHQLKKNSWGILEPEQGLPVETYNIDLVLVPLLAFDRQGYRIGYGKGYYDKFLARCKSETKKVGISFFPPLENLPLSDLDVKLDACITPDQLYSFN